MISLSPPLSFFREQREQLRDSLINGSMTRALTYYIQGNNTKTLFFFSLLHTTVPNWVSRIDLFHYRFLSLFLPWCVPKSTYHVPLTSSVVVFSPVLVVNFKLCPACYISPIRRSSFPLVIDATLATAAIPSNNRFASPEWWQTREFHNVLHVWDIVI